MARILAIDYGKKRCGLAVTDPLQIVATALTALSTTELMAFLEQYFTEQEVEAVVLGMPTNLEGQDTDATASVRTWEGQFRKKFPKMPLFLHDERFTSKIALQAMIQAGTKKKDRQNKENIDKVSAVVILQSFLESQAPK